MRNFKYTGVVSGCDARTTNTKYRAYLRETKIYWITKNGTKFHKRTGRGIGDWPLFSLDLNTIKAN